jgi:hypothetical protein
MDDCVPGCRDIVKAAVLRRQTPPSEVEMLFVEVADLITDDFTFVKRAIGVIEVDTDQSTLKAFMFFIALHFNHTRWDDVRYMPEFDAFTGNLHLFPIATNAFLQSLDVFFRSSNSDEGKNEAFVIFFATMAQIVAARRSRNLASSANAITILADLYARRTGVEYGRIEQSFPARLINAAYAQGARGIPTKSK